MENEIRCPKCQGEMKLVPAGVSKKTGKPYGEFYSCKVWECGGTLRIPTTGEKPQEGGKSYATGGYVKRDSFPKKDFKTTMDYKAGQIQKAQDAKEESIKIASSGRDAVLIVTEFYKNDTFSDDQIKSKILEWRDWMYKNIYTVDDATYKSLNVPF